MEKGEVSCPRAPESDFLQWGNKKRSRCFKVKKEEIVKKPIGLSSRRSYTRVVRADKESVPLPLSRKRRFDSPTRSENRKLQSSSPEKEDRYYSTRGAVFEDGVGGGGGGGGKVLMDGVKEENGFKWPKFFVALSNKEKEEDFLAMKGCKLPQRPKKRAKIIQKSILLVCPGTWLSDLSHERYEVREKKSSKKRPRGLKAMRSMESDSD